MFTIKATYRSETRKFSLPNPSFPTYTQINDQLYRFFPISSSYHLARLLFTQSPSAPFARILIGMEAHSEEEYERHVRPFRGREWPGGLLRFTVYDDEVPHETPNDASTQQGDEDVVMDNPFGPEGGRRRPRRHEHRNGHHHGPHGHHRDHHRWDDIPQWSRPRPTFLAPPPPPLPPPPPPPPPPPFFPPFFHLPSPPPLPPPPPPRSLHGSPGFVPPLPILCRHVPQPAPPLPNLPPIPPLSQNYSQPQSPSPTVDANETPVQRYFRRRGLRSVSSAPVLGPVLPVPPPPAPPPPPPRPVSLYGEIQIGDHSPPIMRPNRRSVIVGDEMDELYDAEARPSADAVDDKGKQREMCCDVERGRQEVTDIIRTFKTDIDRILSQSLGMEPADVWGVTPTVQPDSAPLLSPSNSEHTATNQSQPIETAHSAEPPSSADLVIHENVLCDMCREVIIGIRHKCLDCADFDLCSTCLAVQPLSIGSHSRSHSLFAIEEPGGVWVHTVFTGGSTPEVAEPPATEGPSELPNTSPSPSGSDAQGDSPPIKLAVHHATCDLCDCNIKGDRFKCFDCPDFDTCASCYAIVPSQHPRHSFARLGDPHDLKHSSFSPPLHRANCNECGKIIYGIRYKCMHPACKDFDLCASCEALPIPVHPTTHAMLKIREPDAYIPVVRRYGVQRVPTPVASAPAAQRSQKDETTAHPQAHMNTNIGTIRFGQFDPDAMPSPTPLNAHLSEPSPKLPTELVDVSYPEPEHDVYGESPKMPVAFASDTLIGMGDSNIPSPLARYSIPSAAPLLPVPSPPPALATEFFHAVPSLHQNSGNAQDLISELHGSDASSAPWWGPSTWVPPTPPAPLPVPLRTPSTRRSQSPELLVRFDEQGNTVIPSADMLPAATSLVPEFDRGPSPSLPRVPPVDFNELFDLASQFRHLLELPPVINPPSLPALPREVPNGSRAESIGVEEVSAPTELASTQVDDAGTPLSLVALLSKPEKAPRPGVFDAISPGRLLSQLLDSTSTTSLSSPVDKKKSVDEDAPLRASFIADNNIPDGQIFPPGAEFVKSWRMRNDGPGPWPADTELVFVAGDKLMMDTTERFKVGSVPPGEEVDVWTGEMKAPDVPGKYISYWRLCDSKGRRFGHSIWVDICVTEPTKAPVPKEGSESLASSSVVMPHAAPSNPTVPIPSHDESTTAPLLSDASSASLIDVLSDDDDDDDDDDDNDSEVYEDSQSHFGSTPGNNQVLSPDVEYVVLSDDSDDF